MILVLIVLTEQPLQLVTGGHVALYLQLPGVMVKQPQIIIPGLGAGGIISFALLMHMVVLPAIQ